MTTIPTIDKEKNSLELHVDLCAERYRALDERLGNVENKLDMVIDRMDQVNAALGRTIIRASAPVIVAIITLIGVIITKF
jgi:tetrahydromethanopterin S-methyltransferase subunit G